MTRLLFAVRCVPRLFLSLAATAALAPLAARADLQPGYAQVEYIEATGTQYINTDISVTRDTRMVCDFQFTAVPTATARNGWCGSGSGVSVGFYFGGNFMDKNGNFGTSGTMVFTASAATTRSAFVMHTPTGTFDLDRHTFDISRGSMKFDGVEFAADNDLDYYPDNDKGHIWLFAGQRSWASGAGYPCQMRIYSCQIYRGETMVRDFVPAKRTSDGAAGLYDRATGLFFGNSGSGALIAGGEMQDVPTTLNPSSFRYSMKIRPSAGVLTSSLSDFPVLVRFSEAIRGFSYETCEPDALRFALPDGTLLDHEIDTWNTNGESTVWVGIPELASDTVFHAYWGLRPGKDMPSVAWGNAWANASYKSVWHMNINYAATIDSVYCYGATLLNANEYCGAGAGVVGGGYHNEENWDGSNGIMHGLSTTAIAGFSANSATPAVATFSGWVRQIGGTCQNGFPDEANYPHIKWTDDYGNCGAIINTRNGLVYQNDGVMMCLSGRNGTLDDGYDRSKYLQVRNNSEKDTDSLFYGGELGIDSIFDKAWHHIVIRFDGTNRNLFLDGVLQNSITAPAYYGSGVKGTVGVGIGHRGDEQPTCVWTGDLDEFRFRAVSSSDEWIAAEYASQANPNFLTYSAVSSGNGFTIIVR